jgi:uncharacterized protein Veg
MTASREAAKTAKALKPLVHTKEVLASRHGPAVALHAMAGRRKNRHGEDY